MTNETLHASNDHAAQSTVVAPRTNNARYNLRAPHPVQARQEFMMLEENWTKIYQKEHEPSRDKYEPLDISSNPIILKPGEVRGIYIHSSIDDDTGIVYDNQQRHKTHDDKFITILPGRSHVCTKPFSRTPIWGYGSGWRDNREFVGRLSYGVVYDLWNPSENLRFGDGFRHLVLTLFACQRRIESPLCSLPDDCIYYILNMCRYDWADDNFEDVRKQRRKLRSRLAIAEGTNNDDSNMEDATDENQDDSINEQNMEAEAYIVDTEAHHDAEMQVEEDEDNDIEGDDDDDVYDEDFEESDGDLDDDNFDLEVQRDVRFQYNTYDDLESDDEAAAAESQRLHRDNMERRRRMMRMHILRHWHPNVRFVQDSDMSEEDEDDNE